MTAHSSFRSDSTNLNVLRAIAVLCVFIDHLVLSISPSHPLASRSSSHPFFLHLGHVGVLLFFVHTALVLLLSLDRQKNTTTQNLWTRFMLRRAFRIYPLSALAVTVYCVLRIPELRSPFPAVSFSDIAANLLLVQNLTLSHSVPQVLWSLPFEVQMYCVLPLIYIGIKRDYRTAALKLFLLAFGFVAFSQVNVLLPAHLPSRIINLFEFVPCFLMGAVAYCVPRSHRISAWLWPFFVCLAVLVYSAGASAFTIWYEWPLCAAIGIALPHFGELSKSLFTKAAEYIARYSYGIYLLHGAVMWMSFKVLGLGAFSGTIVSCVLTVLLAMAAYHAIEKPMIEYGTRTSSRFGRIALAEACD